MRALIVHDLQRKQDKKKTLRNRRKSKNAVERRTGQNQEESKTDNTINYEMIVFSGFYSESETVTGKVDVLNLERPQSGL